MTGKKGKKKSDESDGKYPISEYPDCRDRAELLGIKFVVYGFKPRMFALWKKGEPYFRSEDIGKIRTELGIGESTA